ncbi:MAG: TonB-dependent receptor [Flavobacteriaceae bacterium]|nr:TonB-dependent receptor [Flavobacteriaceae bacterium]
MKHLKKFSWLVLLFFPCITFAQQLVSGKVLDKNTNAPIPGVTILVKGTTNGTTTDFDGNFGLSVPNTNAILVISYIGFATQEIPANSQNVTIYLEETSLALDEIVLVGYGQTTKKDATGSIEQVTSESFNRGAITSPEQLIAGKTAGVQVIPAGGRPGAQGTIRIRGGVNSLSANTSPLIVIDGVPIDQQGPALNSVNPNDIETFTILKDASATAIYGSRASAGVILITTKSGKGGPLKINFDSYVTSQLPTDFVDVLNANEFRELINAKGTPNQIAQLGGFNTDWQDQIYKAGYGTNNDLTLSGAYKNTTYRVSLGYQLQDGILRTSRFERYNSSVKVTQKLFKNALKIDLNLRNSIVDERFANQGAIGSAVNFDPTQPVFSGNDAFGGFFESLDTDGTPKDIVPRNPVGLLKNNRNLGETRRSVGNIQFDYKIPYVEGLKANLNLGYDYNDFRGTTTIPAVAADGFDEGGSVTNTFSLQRNLLVDFYLNYVKEFESLKSKIDVTAGHSFQDFHRENGFNRLNGINQTQEDFFATENALESYFGRLNYSYANKYLFTYTVRRDGSSRFSDDNKWGTFQSGAVAWTVSEENFLKDHKIISTIKLRAGWGETGQQEVDSDFPFLPTFTFGDSRSQAQFGDEFIPTIRPEGFDANIKWEESKTWNFGLDWGLFNDRITGSVEGFLTDTNDVLSRIPTAAGTNLDNVLLTNVGNLESEGLEITLNATPIQTKDFEWNFNFNIAFLNNKITKLTASDDPTFRGNLVGGISGGVGNTIQINTVGFGQNKFFVFEQAFDTNGKPIEGFYVDQNGDGVINIDDRRQYRDPNPDTVLGFSSYFKYKQFDLNFTLRANFGNYVYNNQAASSGNFSQTNTLDTNTNVHGSILRTDFQEQLLFSDYFVQDASFLKMDNITLAYNFNKLFDQKIGLRVYSTVQNVFTITDYDGLDPEVSGGIDNNLFPRPRTFLVGFNLTY